MNAMEAIAKREERLEALEKLAEASPVFQAVRAQQAAETLAKRQEAARKIELSRNEEAATIQKLQAVRAEKEKIYLAAKVTLQAASDEFQTAHAALLKERSQFSSDIGRQEQVLIETAPAEIGKAIAFFLGKLDFLMAPGRISRNAVGSERNIFAWKKTVQEESNVEAIHSAMAYCRAALAELEQMKLLPAVDASKIEKMKKSIPIIDVYTVYTGEKPMEKINTDPRSLLPSDSQIDWEIGKLKEKFKKVMGK